MLENSKEQKSFKEDILREIKVKDFLLEKLKKRNVTLELLMKKAVKIMQNPTVMKDAFKRFNFDKVTYNMDDRKNIIEVEYLSDNLDGQGSCSANGDTFNLG